MECFFDEAGHVYRLIQRTGLVPQPLVMALPVWLPPCVPRLEGSLRLSDVRTATATRNFIHDIGLLLDRVGVCDLGELPM